MIFFSISSHIVFITVFFSLYIELSYCLYYWNVCLLKWSPYELSYCLYHWNVCLLIWFTLWLLILSLSLKCLSVSICWYDFFSISSHIVFITVFFSLNIELSYCLYHWNVCLLIWFTLWALILSLSLKCLSVNMIHPMSSHIVFIIEMSVC